MKQGSICLLLSVFLVWGCTTVAGPGLDREEAKQPPAEQKTPPVVARVNGKGIPFALYQRLLKGMGEPKTESGSPPSPEDWQALKEEVLNRLITLELLGQRADALNIQVSREEVDEQIRAAKGGMSEGDYLKALEEQGMSEEEYRAEVERNLRIQKLLNEEVLAGITVDPREVEEYYRSNPARFHQPERVRLRHILVALPEGATEEQRREARATIEKAAQRIREGEPFPKLAQEISQDPTAPKGGELGLVSRGQLIPELEPVVFSLGMGQMSDIIETRFGYHLFRVEGKRAALNLSLERARPLIQAQLTEEKRQGALSAYVEKLQKEARIERFLPVGDP